MIDCIENFTEKSWKNYTIESGFFNKRNIIFGKNGTGKSALSQVLVKKQQEYNQKFRYYSESYKDDSIIISERNGLKGVQANFGQEAVLNIHQVQKLKNEIVPESKISHLKNNSEEQLMRLLRIIFDQHKGNIRVNFPSSKESLDILATYKRFFDDALKKKSIQEIESFISDTSVYEKEIRDLSAISIPKYSDLDKFKSTIDKLREFENKTYSNVEIPEHKIITWIDSGKKIHEEKGMEVCYFCHGKLNFDELTLRIEQYSKDQRNKDAKKLSEAHENISSYYEWLSNHREELERFENIYDIPSDVDFGKILLRLDDLLNKLESKIKSIETIVDFSFEDVEEISAKVNLLAVKVEETIGSQISNAKYNVDRIANFVKAKIYFHMVTNKDVRFYLERKKTCSELKDILEEQNIELDQRIEYLKEISSNYSDFMNFLNTILEELDVKFRLHQDHADERIYILKDLMGEDLSIEEISEGEKRLLSIVYFYFELFSDKNQNNFKNDEIELIVIDDPITSLDEGNRFYIIEIIKEILSIRSDNLQVFVLTHSWSDFCDITYFF